MMTEANTENQEEVSKEQYQELQNRFMFLQDQMNLNQESYYRQQVLLAMERQAIALEKLTDLLTSLKTSKKK